MSAHIRNSTVDDDSAATLSLLDYASLSMGLEVVPHRALEVFACFGLDATTGPRAMGAWSVWLKSEPRAAAECTQMRARMRAHWERWDAHAWAMKMTPSPSDPGEPVVESRREERSQVRTRQREGLSDSPKIAGATLPASVHLAPLGCRSLSLSTIDLASLSMALEVLPERAVDVLATFGARTESARAAAKGALAVLIESSQLDRAQWERMRASMRDHWRRWAAANPKVTAALKHRPRKSYVRPARFLPPVVETTVAAPLPSPPPAVLSLVDYARMRRELDRTPHRADAIHGAYGLDRLTAERELAAWTRRLQEHPDERAQLAQLWSELEAAQAPLAQRPAPSTSTPPIDLFTYSVLCVELDIDPSRSELIYTRVGLTDPAARERAHTHWQARFEVDPAARSEWFMQVDRLRRNWRKTS